MRPMNLGSRTYTFDVEPLDETIPVEAPRPVEPEPERRDAEPVREPAPV